MRIRGAKKYPEAIEAYQKALAIKPDSGAYHNALADAYAKVGTDRQGGRRVRRGRAGGSGERRHATTSTMGAVFTNTGKSMRPSRPSTRRSRLDPNRAEAYYWKGVNMMGKATTGKDGKFTAPPGTAEAFQKYLELKPDGPMAQTAKDMLASLGSSVETTFGKQKAAPAKKKP